MFDGKRAVGVEVFYQGERQTVRARREDCAVGGAIGSPQLLMVSGIGDPEGLTPHGIDVLHELPGVGQNLQDHLQARPVLQDRRFRPSTPRSATSLKQALIALHYAACADRPDDDGGQSWHGVSEDPSRSGRHPISSFTSSRSAPRQDQRWATSISTLSRPRVLQLAPGKHGRIWNCARPTWATIRRSTPTIWRPIPIRRLLVEGIRIARRIARSQPGGRRDHGRIHARRDRFRTTTLTRC